MKSLDEIMNDQKADKGSIWHGFAQHYDALFSRWRFDDITLLEIGIQFGNSARGWLEYFEKAKIIGLDISDPPKIDDPRWHWAKGDQADAEFMEFLGREQGPFRIIIDDGSHRAADAKVSFEVLWPHLQPDGYYVIEDTCAYWDHAFASSVSGPEWLKHLIANVNWHGRDYHGKPGRAAYTPNQMEASMAEIRFWKHLCVIRKA